MIPLLCIVLGVAVCQPTLSASAVKSLSGALVLPDALFYSCAAIATLHIAGASAVTQTALHWLLRGGATYLVWHLRPSLLPFVAAGVALSLALQWRVVTPGVAAVLLSATALLSNLDRLWARGSPQTGVVGAVLLACSVALLSQGLEPRRRRRVPRDGSAPSQPSDADVGDDDGDSGGGSGRACQP